MSKKILKRKFYIRLQDGETVQWFVWKWTVFEYDPDTKRYYPTYFDNESDALNFLKG